MNLENPTLTTHNEKYQKTIDINKCLLRFEWYIMDSENINET